MKALVMKEYMKLVYEEVPVPECKEDEVLIRVMACSICGGDVHGIDGHSGRRVPPIIMGHEASGIIEKTGARANRFQPGERVTFDSMIYCGKCEACLRGQPNLCEKLQVIGVTNNGVTRNGAFAEYIAVPERIVYRLPETVSFLEAAMLEPLSVAYHATSRFPIPEGGTAAVVGVGAIGSLILQVLKCRGVRAVAAVDIMEEKLQSAKEAGAALAVNAKASDALSQLLRLSPKGFDGAYDATGTDESINLCLSLLRPGGCMSVIGNLEQKISLPLQSLVVRQLSVFGSYASASEYEKCLELIARKQIDMSRFISRVAPMSEGNDWFSRLYHKEKGLSKVVLIPDSAAAEVL